MSGKIELGRDMAERIQACLEAHSYVESTKLANELRAMLAASVVERHAPHCKMIDPEEPDCVCTCRGTAPPAPAVVPDGWKLVPIEPTAMMIHRGDLNWGWRVEKIYKAMINDAPACLDKVKELNDGR